MCDYNTFEVVQSATASNQRYTKDGDSAGVGFKMLEVLGIDLFADETVGNAQALSSTTSGTNHGTAYFFNTQFMHVAVLRGRGFDLGEFVKVQDQTSETAKVTWSGIVYTSNRRKQGVLFGIDNTLTS